MYHHVRPIMCPPRYVEHNRFVPRVVPYIHPVINVNRTHIVNVPRHIYQPVTRNVVIDPGYPRRCYW
ncbi:MAG TPA: hypothetical protein GX497_13085 [Bacillus bacterium]|nr:hypothetical protein [Bacillus sp. (in: firmicutes)]